ncbi:hypothetical protein COBT_003050 [Conglomerata obtusa]
MLKNILIYEDYWTKEKFIFLANQRLKQNHVRSFIVKICFDYVIYHKNYNFLIAHVSAFIDEGLKWRNNIFIEENTQIHKYVSLGRNVYVGINSKILYNTKIGDYSWFSSNNFVTYGSKIGENNFFCNEVNIGDDKDDFSDVFKPVDPKNNAFEFYSNKRIDVWNVKTEDDIFFDAFTKVPSYSIVKFGRNTINRKRLYES